MSLRYSALSISYLAKLTADFNSVCQDVVHECLLLAQSGHDTQFDDVRSKGQSGHRADVWEWKAPHRLGITRTQTGADGSRAIRNGQSQRPAPQLPQRKRQS